MEEIWKPILEFESYDVSSLGRIRTWKRHVRKWRNPCSGRRNEPIIIYGVTTPLGYTAFSLRKDGSPKPYRILLHRAVAFAFLGNPMDGQTDVAHLDGNPSNNHVTNLKWTTHKENQDMMAQHGTMQYGEKCVTCKLKESQVLYIIQKIKEYGRGSQVRLAKELGMSTAQISRIKNARRWRHIER